MRVNIKLDERASGESKIGFPIVVVIRDDYKQRIIRTGYHSYVKHWNKNLSAPKSNHPKFYEINDYFLKIKLRISQLMANRLEQKISIANFKDELFKDNYPVFYDAAMNTLPENYTGTKWSALKSFNSFYPSLKFHEITRQIVADFIVKLFEKGNGPGGIDSYIRSLRAFWYKLSDQPNPFAKHKIAIPKKLKRVSTVEDMQKLAAAELEDKGQIASFSKLRDYWLLMFYFGGIDPEVLAKLRYDKNIVNGRLVFNRDKGGSKMPCNNVIGPAASEILQKYDCRPFLVPIHKTKNPDSFIRNFRRGLIKISERLEFGTVMHPKSARYSFIDRAQQLLVDERVTAQIVGHKRKTTTSLYTNDFPLEVQDESHLKIISF
nr:hypothetical protein [uncultured Allomuricauda sp.]